MGSSQDSVVKTEIAPFGIVWKQQMTRPDISPQAKGLLALLATYARAGEGAVWPAQETLAEHMGVSQKTISNWISELVKAGVITREYRARVDPTWKGNPAARLYTLKAPKRTKSRADIPRGIKATPEITTNNTNVSVPYINKSKKRINLTNGNGKGNVVDTNPPDNLPADPDGSLEIEIDRDFIPPEKDKWAENEKKRKQLEMLDRV